MRRAFRLLLFLLGTRAGTYALTQGRHACPFSSLDGRQRTEVLKLWRDSPVADFLELKALNVSSGVPFFEK